METEATETSKTVAEGSPELLPLQEQSPARIEEKKNLKAMVAVDESDESFYALKWALDNLFPAAASTVAAALPETNQELGTVTVVHVLHPFQPYVLPAGPGLTNQIFNACKAVFGTTSMVESVRKAQDQNAAAVLSRALQLCKQKMIKADTLILHGDPNEMICQAAEQMNVDLVIVGSRGLGKIKRTLLGSVSDYCAHHVKCPILIVKPPK